MYAPFGAGVLVGPRSDLRDRRPVPGRRRRGRPRRPRRGGVDRPARAGGGRLAQRRSARSPSTPPSTSWPASGGRRSSPTTTPWPPGCATGLAAIHGVRLLGPDSTVATLPVATFVVDGVHHALVAARLSAEHAIGVRHGCFCAHPYLLRLLGLDEDEVAELPRGRAPGRPAQHPRGGAGQRRLSTTAADIDRFLAAVADIAGGGGPRPLRPGPDTGDYWPRTGAGWSAAARRPGTSCAPGMTGSCPSPAPTSTRPPTSPRRRGLRGLPGHRRPVGPPAGVHVVRPRRVLRQLAQPPRHRPLPGHATPRPELRAGRGLVVVLRRRGRLPRRRGPSFDTRYPRAPVPGGRHRRAGRLRDPRLPDPGLGAVRLPRRRGTAGCGGVHVRRRQVPDRPDHPGGGPGPRPGGGAVAGVVRLGGHRGGAGGTGGRRLRRVGGADDRRGRGVGARRSGRHQLADRELPRVSGGDQRGGTGRAGPSPGREVRGRDPHAAVDDRRPARRRRLSWAPSATAPGAGPGGAGGDRCRLAPAGGGGGRSPAARRRVLRGRRQRGSRGARARTSSSSGPATRPARRRSTSPSTPGSVTILARGESLCESMSSYLAQRIEEAPNIAFRPRTEVVGVEGDDWLRTDTIRELRTGAGETVAAHALFICIGGQPRTAWAERGRSAHRPRRLPADRPRRVRPRAQPGAGRSGATTAIRIPWRRACPGCSRRATSGSGRPSGSRPRSGKGPRRCPSSTAILAER